MWPNLNTKLASIITRSGVDSKQTNNHTLVSPYPHSEEMVSSTEQRKVYLS